MKLLFIDESGTNNLVKDDPEYPVFILAGTSFDMQHYENNVIPEIKAFKIKYFGTSDMILHSLEMLRPKKYPVYGFLAQVANRKNFYHDLELILQKIKFEIIAVQIDKRKFREKYGEDFLDPYEYGLHMLLERFCFDVTKSSTGHVYVEKRGGNYDQLTSLAWESIKLGGTLYRKADFFNERISKFHIHAKEENIIGTQISDLIALPIGRSFLSKKPYFNYELIENKFRKRNGKIEGCGLIKRP